MKRAPMQTSFQVWRESPSITVRDMPTMPRRDLSHIELVRYEHEHEHEDCSPDLFFSDMAEHCAEIVYLHNLKLFSMRGTSEHEELQRRMRDAAHKIVGKATFDFFDVYRGPLGSQGDLPGPDKKPSFEEEAIWTCYWVTLTFKMLARESGDNGADLVGRYIQALFDWWHLVSGHGLAKVNAVVRGPSQVLMKGGAL